MKSPRRPIPVCYMISNLTVGGTPKHLLSLINHLDRTRVTPILCLLDGTSPVSRSLEPSDIQVYRLGIQKIRSIRGFMALREFSRTLRQQCIQIVQPYYPDSTLFSVVAGRLAGVPVILRTRNNTNYWMSSKERKLGRILNRFLTATVCNCQAARQAVLRDERPEPSSVVVIENGIDLTRFQPRPHVRQTGDDRKVGMVTSLRTIKGYDLFLRAAAQLLASHPDVTFHLAAATNSKHATRLQGMVRDLELGERLIYHGPVADVPAFLATLDLAVLSSRSEGMSNAIMEYMAMQLPIVATNVGGIPELIRDGIDGLLVPPDAGALANAMTRLLDHPQLAQTLAFSARQKLDASFSMVHAAQRWARWYEQLLEAREHSRLILPQPLPVRA